MSQRNSGELDRVDEALCSSPVQAGSSINALDEGDLVGTKPNP
jgi:hypothetical protein